MLFLLESGNVHINTNLISEIRCEKISLGYYRYTIVMNNTNEYEIPENQALYLIRSMR